MKKNFIFPKGVRFATIEEIPNQDDKESTNYKYKNAIIEVGYTMISTEGDNYKNYAEINVSSPDIWIVFERLSKLLLPKVSAPILGLLDEEKDELYYGPYLNRDKILNILSEFKNELANDGFIQFGIIHQQNMKTEEIFVHPTKHFSVWTNHTDLFHQQMEIFEIPEYDKLNFIDEFPRTTLSKYEGMRINNREVLEQLKMKFHLLE